MNESRRGDKRPPELNADAFSLKVVRWFYVLSPPAAIAFSALLQQLFGRDFQLYRQLALAGSKPVLLGAALGLAVGLICGAAVLKLRWLDKLRCIIREMFSRVRPRWYDLGLTALCAGFSEELLFRGVLQPLTGLWISAALFAAVHVGPRFKGGPLLFGLFVFFIGLGLGVVCKTLGLAAAMASHASLDLILLLQYRIFLRSDL
jgi:membrane protease YdiL (CAAX protease family)